MPTEAVLAERESPIQFKYCNLVSPVHLMGESVWRDEQENRQDIPNVFIRAFSPAPAPQEVQRMVHINYNSPLDAAGFEVQKDVNGFWADYQKALNEGKTREEAFRISLSERVVNIRTYIVEYARQGLVLPHMIGLDKGKLINTHNGQEKLPGISSQERGGAVRAATEQIENFFANVDEGIAVNTSPRGKMGFFNKDGLEFEYFNCQTFIYKKGVDGSFEGVSLVSDMTLDQNRQLMRRLGVSENLLTVENIVRNPALLTPNLGRSISIEDVAEMILDIRGEGKIRLINAKEEVEYRSVSGMRRDLSRRSELLKFNRETESECEGYIDDFVKSVAAAFNTVDAKSFMNKLALELERVILKVTSKVKPKAQWRPYELSRDYSLKEQHQYGGYNDLSEQARLLREYAPEIAYLKERAGCASVGGSRVGGSGYMMSSEIALALVANPNLEAKQCLSCREVNICGKDQCYACKGTLVDINKN